MRGTATISALPLVGLLAAGCACESGIDITGDRDADADDTFEAAPDTTEVYWDPDPIEPFPDPGPPDPGPPDPWVPESWDAPFDYMDIPADYAPDSAGCGNGVVDPGEECDDSNLDDHDECTNRCLRPRCGDGSLWYGTEDCDPPGTIRPCTTSCGSVGGEWCEVFCRWTGECVPPMEICGNGADDDCDGIVDSIVWLAQSEVAAADYIPVADPTIAWTGSVFGILWVADPDQPVLSLVDGFGRKAGWDVDLALGEWDTLHPLVWSGSLFGVLYVEEGSEHGNGTARFAPFDEVGFQFVPPVDVAYYYTDTPGERGYITPITEYPGGYGLVVSRIYTDVETEYWMAFLSLVTFGIDGSSIVDHGPMLEYALVDDEFYAHRMVWTGDAFSLLAAHAPDPSFPDPEMYLLRVDADGTLLGSAIMPITFPLSDTECLEYAGECVTNLVWTGSAMAWTIEGYPPSDLQLSLHDATGTLVAAGTPVVSHYTGGARLAWTGSEFGLVWTGDTEGFWFAPVAADASLDGAPARIVSSGYRDPSLVWTGSSFGVAWAGDTAINFAHFLSCP